MLSCLLQGQIKKLSQRIVNIPKQKRGCLWGSSSLSFVFNLSDQQSYRLF